ncbi:helix-turn-helix domain-containing protein [Halorussus litoreus]|uniref:helix-turn-helix domain-containing protein n=1 Tax=Halorussus litoreus TaxID=1710536 RepID=UPI000E2771CB|nr:helix-turn-helix domain-containing protein [Halorussus litoreus]
MSTHPMHAFVAERPEYGPTRLLQWNPRVGETNVLLFHVDGPKEPFFAELGDLSTVDYVDSSVASETDGFYLYVREQLEGGDRTLVAAYAGEDVVVVPPVVYDVDKSIQLTIVGEASALQRTLEQTPETVDISVQRIRSQVPDVAYPGSQLTDRQQEIIATAIEAGYYEEPREATVADVSDRLDCGPSTVAQHLRKAESRLVHRAVGVSGRSEQSIDDL